MRGLTPCYKGSVKRGARTPPMFGATPVVSLSMCCAINFNSITAYSEIYLLIALWPTSITIHKAK